MKKRKRRLKKKVYVFLIFFLLTIGGIIYILSKPDNKEEKVKPDNKPKINLNYSEDNLKVLEKDVSKNNIDYLINNKVDEQTAMPIINETYYIDDYLTKYLDYQKGHQDKQPKEIITIINTHINDEFYTNTMKTDTSLGKFVILNKYYYADNSYHAPDLIEIDSEYSLYGSTYKIELSKECFEAFLKMYTDAKEAGYGFKINSAYRSYDKQETIYNRYVKSDGQAKADTYSARPGYSEHQTGYAFDVRDFPYTNEDYSKTKSFTWVSENAYKYGFIIRFPKDKEYITGYQYESWHYRYCGLECSTYIHNHDITFEEYYEYFIKYNNPRNLKD